MKKCIYNFASMLLIFSLIVGCGKQTDTETTATEAPTTEQATITTDASVPEETTVETETESAEGDIVYEGDASTYYIDVAYAEQIARYHTANSE